MSMQQAWARDYDLFDPAYVADPYPIWDELRSRPPARNPSAKTIAIDHANRSPEAGRQRRRPSSPTHWPASRCQPSRTSRPDDVW